MNNDNKKQWYKVSEVTERGWPRQFVLNCCNSIYGHRFAQKTCTHGMWLVNLERFEKCVAEGYFRQ